LFEILSDIIQEKILLSDLNKDRCGKGQAAIKAPEVEVVEVTGLPYCLTQHSN
jgi:hypothetical protein